mgnify:CR=1 FL=1
MRRRGDNVAVFEGVIDSLAGDKAADVSHVTEQVRVVLVGDLPERGIVQIPGVARRTCSTQSRSSDQRLPLVSIAE